ncbi:hypothetical protein GGX14DRAFT_634188 [Mycena pura]|uniref:Uncharacterized protein n=1 Tax=Mycena pura TaxID=153505 RepID=A0AAD6YBQ5_9AGAR|nr:hypothetical protein GGX14DRAFT_634188 [Mycena pura]
MSAVATASVVEAKLHALATANLVEALLESVLYGVYGVLCITVLYLFRSRERRPAVWVSTGLVIQFFTITGHWIGTLYATLFAFGHLNGGTAAAAFYDNLSSAWYLTNLSFLGATFLVTNLLVIHRVHVIFSNNRTVTGLPFIILMVEMVSLVGLVYQFAKSHPGEQSIVIYGLSNPWVTTSLVTSMVLVFAPTISAYSTGMISWKILRITRALNRLLDRIDGGVPLMSILAIIVESAALHMAITISTLVTYHVGFVGQVVFSGISPVVIGISTILIHARSGLGWAHGSGSDGAASNPTRIGFATSPEGSLELDDRRRK